MPRPSAKDRARAWVAKSAPAAIQGQHGDDATFSVACALVIEFGLPDGDAWELLCEYNRTKCSPAWDERALEGKLRSARNMAAKKPGEVGRLLGQDRGDYTGPKQPSAPAVPAPARPAAAQPPTPMPGMPGRTERTERTARTVPFEVTRAGSGAKRACVHTLRTLTSYSLRIRENGNSVYVRSGAGASDLPVTSAEPPKPKQSCAEASEPSAPKHVAAEPQMGDGEASGTSGGKFGGKQGGGIAAAAAALAEEGIKAGHVVTWIGASGNIVRFGQDGRPRKFGMIKE